LVGSWRASVDGKMSSIASPWRHVAARQILRAGKSDVVIFDAELPGLAFGFAPAAREHGSRNIPSAPSSVARPSVSFEKLDADEARKSAK
jgi:hypothetical protein